MKKQCKNCNKWEKRDNIGKGECSSKERKEEKAVPLNSNYITPGILPGCKFWGETKNNDKD